MNPEIRYSEETVNQCGPDRIRRSQRVHEDPKPG